MSALKIVIIGHVDHGKSTLVGRLLSGTGAIPENRVETVRKTCVEQGKKFEYAFLLDALEEEQSQGVTIDLVRVPFKTKKREYELIDAPGHKEFLKNMISGAASADAAVLLIDINEGVREQSRRHGHIISLLGISQVIVLVNKMDLADYDEEKFKAIVVEYSEYLKKIKVTPLEFLPISALDGENLSAKSKKMPWFKGSYFVEALDNFTTPKDVSTRYFRLPVQDVYKFDSRRIIAGRVASGSLKIGEKVVFLPSEKTGVVKSFEVWQGEAPKKIQVGESVGFTLEDQIFVERGEICVRENELPQVKKALRANIVWMGKEHLKKNKKYILKLATQEVECELVKIEALINSSNLSSSDSSAEVAENEIAQVVLALDEPIAFDLFRDVADTGRFVLIDGYDLCGGGIVNENQVIDPEFSI